MKTSCSIGDIAKVCKLLQPKPFPGMEPVRIEANGRLEFSGFRDGPIAWRVAIPCETETDGAWTVSGPSLLSACKGAPTKVRVAFRIGGEDRRMIAIGGIEKSLEPWADFPALFDEVEWVKKARPEIQFMVELPVATMLRALKACEPARSTDVTRAHLCSVNVQLHKKGDVFFETTDGHRATRFAVKDATAKGPAKDVQLVGDLVAVLLPALALCEPTDRATIVRHSGLVCVRLGDRVTVYAKELDGHFPDFDRVIPATHDTRFAARVKDVQAVCKAAGRENVNLAITWFDGKAEFSGTDPESTFHAEVPEFSQDQYLLGLNRSYLNDVCDLAKLLGAKDIEFDTVRDEQCACNPVVFEFSGAGFWAQQVLMPCRL